MNLKDYLIQYSEAKVDKGLRGISRDKNIQEPREFRIIMSLYPPISSSNPTFYIIHCGN